MAVLGLCWCVFFFLVAESRSYCLVVVRKLLIVVASYCRAWTTGRVGFSSYGTWAKQLRLPGSRAQAQQLWCMGLVTPWHVGSSQKRDRTNVSCNGRQILYH